MLRAARELLAVRSPLDAELMVSELLGTWWGQRSTRPGGREVRRRRADVEELVGEGLVAYAAQQGSPAALALLSGIACLGTPRQAASAEQAALALMERGVARPGWAEHVGAVVAAECYLNSDAYGDRDEVVCVFSYAGQEQHALVVVVDYNTGGLARDGWVTSQVDKLLDYCGQADVHVHAGPAAAGAQAAGVGARGHREGHRPSGQQLVPVLPRVHQGPGAHPAAQRVLAESPIGHLQPAAGRRPSGQPGHDRHRARTAAAFPPGGRAGARTAGRRWSRSSSPPTRPRTCPTARPRAAALTTS